MKSNRVKRAEQNKSPTSIVNRADEVVIVILSFRNPSSLEYLSPHQVATAVINAIIYNKLNVSVPSYYLLLINFYKYANVIPIFEQTNLSLLNFRLLPKEIQNRCRDKFKPMLHNYSATNVYQFEVSFRDRSK